jgi:hypothetical protein
MGRQSPLGFARMKSRVAFIIVGADVRLKYSPGSDGGSAVRKMRKAAEDSRTPRRWREIARATCSARFWSAAVLCRFFRMF